MKENCTKAKRKGNNNRSGNDKRNLTAKREKN